MLIRYWVAGVLALFLIAALIMGASKSSDEKASTTISNTVLKGDEVAKLIFIHHSVGGHWLAHEYGGLVSELNRSGFYVNDITYGWLPPQASSWKGRLFGLFGVAPTGADHIGDRTDIGHFYDWFVGPDAAMIMDAVYRENNETEQFGGHGNSINNPGLEIENEIVMIKPCYPNSLYLGNGEDEPSAGDNPPRNFIAGSDQHTVANSKRIYNDILTYFASRPDKFFVIVTAPPRQELPENGRIARAFSNWLVHDWLSENNYQGNNVMVFDLFNVLTSGTDWKTNDLGAEEGNHHRLIEGVEQHQVSDTNNELIYPRDGNNNHPSPAGLQKATGEFIGLLKSNYSRWVETGQEHSSATETGRGK